jgi:hypothetical protein
MEIEHSEAYNFNSQDGQNNIHVIFHPMVLFSINAEYLGQERLLSKPNRDSMDFFAKGFNIPEMPEIYIHEILVRDTDDNVYWLPIQESFLEPFHKEYYKGCKLTLFLILGVIVEHQPFVIVNEFWVE